MFIIVFCLFICLCVLSIFTVYKILEIEKDIDVLYNNYSKELQKSIEINIKRGE